MLRRLGRHSLFLLAFVSACASLRSSSGSPELPGQYAYTTVAHGQPVTGTITITRDHAQYSILMTTRGLTKDLLFTDVSITGDRLTASTEAPNGGRIVLRLAVTGDTITGDWQMASQNAGLRGTRVTETTPK
jgi:hypothetical protein